MATRKAAKTKKKATTKGASTALGRAEFAQCNARISPEGWLRLKALQRAYGGLSQAQALEVVLSEQSRALGLEAADESTKAVRNALIAAANQLHSVAKSI